MNHKKCLSFAPKTLTELISYNKKLFHCVWSYILFSWMLNVLKLLFFFFYILPIEEIKFIHVGSDDTNWKQISKNATCDVVCPRKKCRSFEKNKYSTLYDIIFIFKVQWYVPLMNSMINYLIRKNGVWLFHLMFHPQARDYNKIFLTFKNKKQIYF